MLVVEKTQKGFLPSGRNPFLKSNYINNPDFESN